MLFIKLQWRDIYEYTYNANAVAHDQQFGIRLSAIKKLIVLQHT